MAQHRYALVGIKHRGSAVMSLVETLPPGEQVTLIRDPTNPYDPNAVQVWVRGVHIGFVPTNMNKNLAARMDAAKAEFSGTMAMDGKSRVIETDQ